MKQKNIFCKLGVIVTVLLAAAGVIVGLSTESEAANYCTSTRCKEAASKEAEARQAKENAAAEKNNYQAKVNEKTAEIAEIQAAISRNEAEIAELSIQIDNTTKKIERLTESLKKAIVKLYLNEDVSEFEIFASANSVVDFTTKSANQQVVQGKVKQLATESKQAKADLEQQKKDQEERKAENQARHDVASAMQVELQKFRDDWAGREATYASEAANQQAIINTETSIAQCEVNGGTWRGSYCDYPGGSNSPTPGRLWYRTSDRWYPDTYGWDMSKTWGNGYLGQCTSYAGWKANEQGGYGNASYHQAWGDAKSWANSARARGLYVSTQPSKHSVGVSRSGTYGHVFWVEDVSGGMVYITDYNRAAVEAFGNAMFTIADSDNAGVEYIYIP